MGTGNGWEQWKIAVLDAIENQKNCSNKLSMKIDSLHEKINQYITNQKVFEKEMKIKSGIWGVIGGSFPILITLLIYFLQTIVGAGK